MKIDYYEVLGLSRDADDKTIKSAFRRLAMKYHPDKNPGDKIAEQKFKELGEAYEVLKDPQKRAAYDRYGHAAFNGQGAGFGGFSSSNFGGFADIFGEMFGDIMGGSGFGSSAKAEQRGSDLRYNMSISLLEAYSGIEKEIEIRAPTSCKTCSGTGSAADSKIETCPHCSGRGVQRVQQGFFAIERTCNYCHGSGNIITNPCKTCGGSGRVEQKRNIKVKVPKGVSQGTRLRLSGEGEAGLHGSPSGDLYVFLTITEHKLFLREGNDLYCEVPISMVQAALGGSIELTMLNGKTHQVKIPAGVQNGKKLCLRGEGMPYLQRPSYGDLYIQLNVETPQKLSSRQVELLQEFADLSHSENNPNSNGFFNKMREFFKQI